MDDDRLACIGLASKGYGRGDPDAIEEMHVQTVLDMLAFATFENQYLKTKIYLNRTKD